MVGLKKYLEIIVPGFIVTCMLLFFSVMLINSSVEESKAHEQIDIINELNSFKSQLQSELNSRFYLSKGLEAYIRNVKNIDHASFQSFANSLISDDPAIKNITLLKGTTVIDVFPIEGNEDVIGKDLATIESQRPAIIEAIESKRMVTDGPVNLVQGGEGIINRIPIFLENEGNSEFWGMVSIVMLKDELINKTGFGSPTRGIDALINIVRRGSGQSQFFWGDQSVIGKKPITYDLDIDGNTWQISAIPRFGWKDYSGFIWTWGIIAGLVSILVGVFVSIFISQRIELKKIIHIDPLTQIENRRFFYDRLEETYKISKNLSRKFAILFIDINRFKEINDEYGHVIGDMVLKESADRMKKITKKQWTLARFGGDEFIILMPEIKNIHEVYEFTELIKDQFLKTLFVFDTQTLDVTISVGHAVYPDDSEDIESLVSKADFSMYNDKKSEKGTEA